MENSIGVITKHDIIKQDVIDAPLKYIENLQKAIQKQKELIQISTEIGSFNEDTYDKLCNSYIDELHKKLKYIKKAE